MPPPPVLACTPRPLADRAPRGEVLLPALLVGGGSFSPECTGGGCGGGCVERARYGANADGYDMVAPSGVGGEACMELSIAQADSIGGKKRVDYVNTHGACEERQLRQYPWCGCEARRLLQHPRCV